MSNPKYVGVYTYARYNYNRISTGVKEKNDNPVRMKGASGDLEQCQQRIDMLVRSVADGMPVHLVKAEIEKLDEAKGLSLTEDDSDGPVIDGRGEYKKSCRLRLSAI